MSSSTENNKYQRIYNMVKQIPKGTVSTYGDIARFAGLPRQARMVGYALHALPKGHDVPWQRVINAKGAISLESLDEDGEPRQRTKLEEEGVEFKINGTVDLKRFRWQPEPFELPDWDPFSEEL